MAPSCYPPPSPCHCLQSPFVALCWRNRFRSSLRRPDPLNEMLELKPRPIAQPSRPRADRESKQPRRLVLALTVLLVLLVAVIARDHDFWFGNDESSLDGDGNSSEFAQTKSVKTAPVASATKSTAIPANKKSAASAKSKSASIEQPVEPVVATNRTILPPLDVEVIAGDSHRTVRPGNPNSLQITTGTPAATNAAERQLLATSVQPTSGSYETTYPLLAQHMNVEGSVVLQALIGADGTIENLRVVSGPSILTGAAQQAVRQWRFKPVLQNGQPVETKAKITVNFSIKVADNTAKIS